jgi:hypothetical protein
MTPFLSLFWEKADPPDREVSKIVEDNAAAQVLPNFEGLMLDKPAAVRALVCHQLLDPRMDKIFWTPYPKRLTTPHDSPETPAITSENKTRKNNANSSL